MHTLSNSYTYDVMTITYYGEYYAEIAYHPMIILHGEKTKRGRKKEGTSLGKKLCCNISRARSKVWELSLANEWQFACTFTFAPQKVDSSNLIEVLQAFKGLVKKKNRYRSKDSKIKYVIVPEYDDENKWHFHGFIKGMQESDLRRRGCNYFSWIAFEEELGFSDLQPIRDIKDWIRYMLKSLDKTANMLKPYQRLFHPSKYLRRKDKPIYCKGILRCPWDYEDADTGYKKVVIDLRETSINDVFSATAILMDNGEFFDF